MISRFQRRFCSWIRSIKRNMGKALYLLRMAICYLVRYRSDKRALGLLTLQKLKRAALYTNEEPFTIELASLYTTKIQVLKTFSAAKPSDRSEFLTNRTSQRASLRTSLRSNPRKLYQMKKTSNRLSFHPRTPTTMTN